MATKTLERNIHIYEIRRSHPAWTYQDIGNLVGISRQRVQQIVHDVETRGITDIDMELKNNHRLNGEPISATQAARETGIPFGTIRMWAKRGLVKVLEHPGHTAPGRPVLLDPETLQERIDRYRPRPRRNQVSG